MAKLNEPLMPLTSISAESLITTEKHKRFKPIATTNSERLFITTAKLKESLKPKATTNSSESLIAPATHQERFKPLSATNSSEAIIVTIAPQETLKPATATSISAQHEQTLAAVTLAFAAPVILNSLTSPFNVSSSA